MSSDDRQQYDNLIEPLREVWSSALERFQQASGNELPGPFAALLGQAEQRKAFTALNERFDVCLRSPAFLQAMKQHIDAVIQAKQVDDANASEAAKVPTVDPNGNHSGASDCEVVYRAGTLQLLRFRNNQATEFAEPILICFALVNRPYILDLRDRRSVVQQLLKRGFEVYLIDWGTPTLADSQLGLHDYVCRFIKNVADFVCQDAGSEQLNLLGYCMGGTMSTMYASLYPAQIRNLILLATPIDFSGNQSLLNLWAGKEYFDVDGLIDAFGNCPGFFLHSCFQLMKPATSFMKKYVTFTENVENSAFVDNFLALERWSNDSVPIAGKTFREFVKMLYQQNMLVTGKLHLDNVPIQLANITCPIMLLVAENDHLVSAQSTLALADHVSSTDVQTMSVDAGHIGLAVSSKAHQKLWPDAANWIADHSNPKGY